MARTRAQEAAKLNERSLKNGTPKSSSIVKNTSKTEGLHEQTNSAHKRQRRENRKSSHPKRAKKEEAKSVHSIPSLQGKEDVEPAENYNAKLSNLISTYGILPLQDLGLNESTVSKPEKVLALVMNAMLSSVPISHLIARRTVKCLLEENYHRIEDLEASTWEERTHILTRGGYTHYRETTATRLGDLAKLVRDKYGQLLSFPLSKFPLCFLDTICLVK